MTKKATAPGAEAGAATPATTSTAAPVHTSAQAPKANPLHQPTPRRPRDEHTGKGGTYTRDPATGVRTRVPPPATAEGDDNTAAA